MRQCAVSSSPIFYPDGSEVKEIQTDEDGIPHCTIYLGAHISSDSRSTPDIKARLSKASQKYKQLQHVWNSQLTFKQKHIACQAIFLPLITYALPQAVLLQSDLHKLDSWYTHKIRNLLKIKHSFYSHIAHSTAFHRAGCPLLPSTFILKQQMKFFQHFLDASPDDPAFHVCFTPGLSDRVAIGRRRVGRPPIHYLQSLINRCMHICNFLSPPRPIPRPMPSDILLDTKFWQSIIAAPMRWHFRVTDKFAAQGC